MFRLSFILLLASTLPALALAQSQSEAPSHPDKEILSAESFALYAPRTALDMAERIPGISLDSGDNDARGFGQASGNILINGKRLSSKSTSAREALDRIPAENVIRLELIEGATLDIPGLSGLVLNVVAEASGLSGTWTWRMRARENLPPAYDWVEAALTGESGDFGWTLAFENEPRRQANAGRENIFNAAGELASYTIGDFNRTGPETTIGAALKWTPPSSKIANLNFEYSRTNQNQRELEDDYTLADIKVSEFTFTRATDINEAEIAADYAFPWRAGQMKLVGLYRFENSDRRSRAFGSRLDGSEAEDTFFRRDIEESERILRGEYNWPAFGGDWQVSLEGALNTLDSESHLEELNDQGVRAISELDDPIVRVEEKRGEAFITHSRDLSENWNLQLSLGTEISEIQSTGLRAQTRRFTRPKGDLVLSWTPSDTLIINASLERDVGQLDFFDFVSAVDVQDGDNQTGNSDIVPQQAWMAELELDKNFGAYGAGTLRLFAEALEDIPGQVPIGDSEGPGNIESGHRWGIDIDHTVSLEPFGLEGGELDLSYMYQKSEIEDPVTGRKRRINDDLVQRIRAEFRHDIPRTDWAWGFTVRNRLEAPRFRLDTRTDSENTPPFMFAFLEHKDVFGLSATLFVANITDQDDQTTRTLFTPDRTGLAFEKEDATRNFGPIWTFRLEGSF